MDTQREPSPPQGRLRARDFGGISRFWENNGFGPADCALRCGTWKIPQLRTGAGGALGDEWELYDLAGNMGATREVAVQHPDIVGQMDAAYLRWGGQLRQSRMD